MIWPCEHMQQMEVLFNEQGWTPERKFDVLYGHMKETKDPTFVADLSVVLRAAGAVPVGPEYGFQFLWGAVNRRVETIERAKPRVLQKEAKDKELRKVRNEV